MNPFMNIANRHNKELAEKQQQTVHKEEKVEEVEPVKYLSVTDKLELQLAFERIKSCGFEFESIQNKINSLRTLIQNYEMKLSQFKDEEKYLTELLEAKKEQATEVQSNQINLVTKLSIKYELSSAWNFDQNTGKISVK